jgi:hypothetical protein
MFQKYLLGSMTALILFSLLFISCKKDNNDDPAPADQDDDTETSLTVDDAKIVGKWTVGDGSGKLADNNSGYISFEFTKSKGYIIRKSDATYLTGTYTVDASNNKLTLGTFGVVTITKLEETIMEFSLRLTGSETDIKIFSNKTGSLISATTRTDSLCQTWSMKTRYENGAENTLIRDAFANGSIKATLILSSYGTFFSIAEQTGQATTYNNGTWSWTNANQTHLLNSSGTTGLVEFVNGDFHFTYTSNSIEMEEVYELDASN